MSQFGTLYNAKQYTKACSQVLDNNIELEPIKSISEAIRKDSYLMRLYGEENPNRIAAMHQTKVKELQQLLYDPNPVSHILNILEYLKYTCSGEDFIGIPGVLFFESLDNYSFSSCLLGKGTSYSQASFASELLNDSSYQLTKINEVNPNCLYEIKGTSTVLLKNSHYIDPSKYLGKRATQKLAFHYTSPVRELEYSEEEVTKAQAKVAAYLIEQLGITEISKKLFPPEANDFTKHLAILDYLKSTAINYSLPVRYHSVIINGTRLNASKALELFYIANNIPYEVTGDTKENAPLIATLYGAKQVIDMNEILARSPQSNKVYVKK